MIEGHAFSKSTLDYVEASKRIKNSLIKQYILQKDTMSNETCFQQFQMMQP